MSAKEIWEVGALRPADDRAVVNGAASVSAVPASVPSAALKVEAHYAVEERPKEWAFSPDAGMLRLTQHCWRGEEPWWSGEFVDHRGIVTILRQKDYLRLDAVAGNRCHVREWRSYYGDRTVSRLCRAFLTDLLGTAQAIEARQRQDAETGLARKGESAVRKDAPTPTPEPNHE